MNEVNQIVSLVTSSLNIHLNIGQKMIINTSEIFVSFETISIESLFNKQVKQVGGVEIHLSSNLILSFNNNSSVSLRVSIYLINISSPFIFLF